MELLARVSKSPSLNDLHSNRWQMLNWKKRHLKELTGYEYLISPVKVKMRILIIRIGLRKLDKDNLYGGMKPLIDALKAKKFIVDDCDKWLDLEVTQEKCKKKYEECCYILTEAVEK